jgi:hypothetical protein
LQALDLAQVVLGLKLPREVLARISTAQATKKLIAGIFIENNLTEFDDLKLQLSSRDRLLDRLNYLCGRVFIPFGEDFERYPNMFAPLYFVVKPIKVMLRVVRRFVS